MRVLNCVSLCPCTVALLQGTATRAWSSGAALPLSLAAKAAASCTQERRHLARTLRDSKAVMGRLNGALAAVVHILFCFVYLAVWKASKDPAAGSWILQCTCSGTCKLACAEQRSAEQSSPAALHSKRACVMQSSCSINPCVACVAGECGGGLADLLLSCAGLQLHFCQLHPHGV